MRVVDYILFNIFPLNIFLTMLLSARFHQTHKAALGCREHLWVNIIAWHFIFCNVVLMFHFVPMLRLLSSKAQ